MLFSNYRQQNGPPHYYKKKGGLHREWVFKHGNRENWENRLHRESKVGMRLLWHEEDA